MQAKTKISKELYLAELQQVKCKLASNIFEYSVKDSADELCEALVEFIRDNSFLYELTFQDTGDIQILKCFISAVDSIDPKDIQIKDKVMSINRLAKIAVANDLKRKTSEKISASNEDGVEASRPFGKKPTIPTTLSFPLKNGTFFTPNPTDSTSTHPAYLFHKDETHTACEGALVLHQAICRGNIDLVKKELSESTVEKKMKLLTAYCQEDDEFYGATVARLAILGEHAQMLLLLLRLGFPPLHCSISGNNILCDIILCELELDTLIRDVYQIIINSGQGQKIWQELITRSFTNEYVGYSLLDVACVKMHEVNGDKKKQLIFRRLIMDLIKYGAQSYILPQSQHSQSDLFQGKGQEYMVSSLAITIYAAHAKREPPKKYGFNHEDAGVESDKCSAATWLYLLGKTPADEQKTTATQGRDVVSPVNSLHPK